MPHHGTVAEIGVQAGDYAHTILTENEPACLILVDPWRHQEEGYNDVANVPQGEQDALYTEVQKRFRDESRVTIARLFSHEAAHESRNFQFDWIYLDANHTYEHTLTDLGLWWGRLRSGGYLCGHDYDNSYFPGVGRAVQDFCRILRIPHWVTLNDNPCNSFVIQKP